MTKFPQYIVKKPPPVSVSSMDEDSGRGISYDMASSGAATATIPEVEGNGGKGLQEDARSESPGSRRYACIHTMLDRNQILNFVQSKK